MTESDWRVLSQHAGEARLTPYLKATAQDRFAACSLYLWNSSISAAFWETLGHVEVGLRNAIDGQMSQRQTRLRRESHWIFDEHHELGRSDGRRPHTRPYVEVNSAIRRVERNGMPVDAGQVISELPFGFWHQLVSKGQMSIWPDLVGAFPQMRTRSQRPVSNAVGDLRRLRNRIGHHHRIYSLDLNRFFETSRELCGFIDPGFANWLVDNSRVPELLASRPL